MDNIHEHFPIVERHGGVYIVRRGKLAYPCCAACYNNGQLSPTIQADDTERGIVLYCSSGEHVCYVVKLGEDHELPRDLPSFITPPPQPKPVNKPGRPRKKT